MRRFFLRYFTTVSVVLLGCSAPLWANESPAPASVAPVDKPDVPKPTPSASGVSTPELPSAPFVLRPKPQSEQEAQLWALLDNWNLEVLKWKDAYDKADAQKKTLLKGQQPDGKDTARSVWNLIRTSLTSGWTTPGIAWLLGNPQELAKFKDKDNDKRALEIRDALLNAVDAFHVDKSGARELVPVLVAYDYGMARDNRFNSQVLLEKIYRVNTDPIVKAYAALGIALRMRMGGSSFDKEAAVTRATYIVDALRNLKGEAFAGKFGTQKIEDVIREEMYRLDNLTELKLPPQIKAATLDGLIFDSRNSNGKVKLIYFWRPDDPSTNGSIMAVDTLYKKLSSKLDAVVIAPMTMEGIKNFRDERKLTIPIIADTTGAINIDYRTSSSSEAFILDRRGLLRFNEVIQNLLALSTTIDALIAEKDADAPAPAIRGGASSTLRKR